MVLLRLDQPAHLLVGLEVGRAHPDPAGPFETETVCQKLGGFDYHG